MGQGKAKLTMPMASCPVCYDVYDDAHHFPMLIAGCGHTFCRKCIALFIQLRCPSCNERFDPNTTIKNYALVPDKSLPSATVDTSSISEDRKESPLPPFTIRESAQKCPRNHLTRWSSRSSKCWECSNYSMGWACQQCEGCVCDKCANTRFISDRCPNGFLTSLQKNDKLCCFRCGWYRANKGCNECEYYFCSGCLKPR